MKPFITLIGRLGKAAKRATDNLTVFSVAVNYQPKGGEEERTDWYDVLCFGRLGERAISLDRGQPVVVSGRLITEDYNGQLKLRVLASEVNPYAQSSASRAESEQGQPPQEQQIQPPQEQGQQQNLSPRQTSPYSSNTGGNNWGGNQGGGNWGGSQGGSNWPQ